MPKKPPKETKQHRDAGSGRFIERKSGSHSPSHTTRENVPKPGKGDSGKDKKK